MTPRLRWSGQAVKDMRRLPPDVRARIRAAVLLYVNTGRGDAKRLKGSLADWRLRVGDYRVRFVIDEEESALIVTHVLYRSRVYRY